MLDVGFANLVGAGKSPMILWMSWTKLRQQLTLDPSPTQCLQPNDLNFLLSSFINYCPTPLRPPFLLHAIGIANFTTYGPKIDSTVTRRKYARKELAKGDGDAGNAWPYFYQHHACRHLALRGMQPCGECWCVYTNCLI